VGRAILHHRIEQVAKPFDIRIIQRRIHLVRLAKVALEIRAVR
jgi:hypothetical protein